MSFTVQFKRKELVAISKIASTDPCREAINGVRFEKDKNKPLTLIATDGRMLATFQPDWVLQGCDADDDAFTVPPRLIKAIPNSGELQLEWDAEGSMITIGTGYFHIRSKPTELAYPNWRTVIPDTLYDFMKERDVCVSPALLAKASTFLTAIGSDTIRATGDVPSHSPIVLKGAKKSMVVIMPMRIHQ